MCRQASRNGTYGSERLQPTKHCLAPRSSSYSTQFTHFLVLKGECWGNEYNGYERRSLGLRLRVEGIM